MIRLYQAAMSSCSQKVRFVLEQKELTWESIEVDLHGAENYSSSFKKLNPKAIIPVLNDDGQTIIESNNICLYLDEQYPQVSLMPSSAVDRSKVRTLIQLVDEQVHNDSSVCTYAMAFRPRLLASFDTEQKLDAHLREVPDHGRRHIKRQVITHGIACPEFKIAVLRLEAMLQMLEHTLQESHYLVGENLSVADVVYSPYLTRLDHLNMHYLWEDKPKVSIWYDNIRNEVGYQKGIRAYFDEHAIAGMNAAGEEYRQYIEAILAA